MDLLIESLKWSHWVAFEAVARHLHFRKAAEELSIAQPALTRRIMELEEALGYALFERSTRSVSLLPQGEILRDHLPGIVKGFEAALGRAKSAAKGKAGLLRIGVVGTPVMRFIHEPILKFRKAYPDYEISLQEESSSEIVKGIVHQTLECGFFLDSLVHPEITNRKIAHDPLGIAVSNENQLCGRSSLSLGDLEGEKIIIFPKARNPALYRKITDAIPNVTSSDLVEASSRPVAIMMAAAGLGIAIIAESMRLQCPPSVTFVPVEGKSLGADVVMGWLKGRSNVFGPFL